MRKLDNENRDGGWGKTNNRTSGRAARMWSIALRWSVARDEAKRGSNER